MKQQINLFLSLPKKPVVRYTLKFILSASAVFLILLIVLYINKSLQNNSLKNEINQVQLKQKTLNEKMAKLQKLNSKHATTEEINKKIYQLNLDIKEKKQLIEILSQESVFNTSGYSGHMKVFAKLIPKDVWLTNIDIAKSGEIVTLSGYTYNVQNVLDFMHKLEKSPAFKNKKLKLASLSKYSNIINAKNKKRSKKAKRSSSESITIPASAMTKDGKPLLAFMLQTQKGVLQ